MGILSKFFNTKKVSDVYPVTEVSPTTLAEGDFVTVIDKGKRYSSMKQWFSKYGVPELEKMFAPADKPLDTTRQYQAILVNPHVTDSKTIVAAITDAKTYECVYLIGMAGLTKRFSVNLGNKVKITAPGKLYSSYESWFTENKLEVLKPFFRKDEKPNVDETYRVVAAERHSTRDKNRMTMVYAIVDVKTDSKLYLIGMDGIQKI